LFLRSAVGQLAKKDFPPEIDWIEIQNFVDPTWESTISGLSETARKLRNAHRLPHGMVKDGMQIRNVRSRQEQEILKNQRNNITKLVERADLHLRKTLLRISVTSDARIIGRMSGSKYRVLADVTFGDDMKNAVSGVPWVRDIMVAIAGGPDDKADK